MKKKILIIDTNVLLDLYQYTKDTTEKIIDYFEECGFDIFIPPTVTEEYMRHYKEARSKTGPRNPINSFSNIFKKIIDESLKKIDSLRQTELINGLTHDINDKLNKIHDELKKTEDDIQAQLEKLKESNTFDYIDSDDIVYDFVKTNSVEYLSIETKIKWAEEAEKRFKYGLFPGLTDIVKGDYSKSKILSIIESIKGDFSFDKLVAKVYSERSDFRKYGDVFVWLLIIDKCKDYDECLFLENEKKNDWWNTRLTDLNDSMKQEWDEKNPNCSLKILRLDTLIESIAENDDFDPNASAEVLKFRSEMNEILSLDYYIEFFNKNLDSTIELNYYDNFYSYFYHEAVLDWGSPDDVNIEVNDIELINTSIKNVDYSDRKVYVNYEVSVSFYAYGTKYVSREYSDSFHGDGEYTLSIDAEFDIILGMKSVKAEMSDSNFQLNLSFEEKYDDDYEYENDD